MTQILNDLITALGSIIITTFVVGVRWGGLQATLTNIDNRLQRIENMFELVPRNLILKPNHKDNDTRDYGNNG